VSIASRILISLPSIVWGVVFIGTGSIIHLVKSVCAKGKLENLKVKTIFKEKPTLEQKATLTGFTTIE